MKERSIASVLPEPRGSELLVPRNEYRCVSEIQEVKYSKLKITADILTLWTLCEPCSHQSSTERENLRNSYRLPQLVAWIHMRHSDKQKLYSITAASFIRFGVVSHLEAGHHQLRQVYDKTNDSRLKQTYRDSDTPLESQTPDIKLWVGRKMSVDMHTEMPNVTP